MLGVATLFVVVVLPPPQLKVAPEVVDAAVKVMLVVTQVKVPLVGETVALGAVIFRVITICAVEVHPFVVAVTV